MIFINTMNEDQIHKQIRLMLDVALPSNCVVHHSPNEGVRHISLKKKLVALGPKPGWPDLEIFCPRTETLSGNAEALFIEIKTKKGRLSDNQKFIRDILVDAGFGWSLCRSWDDCLNFLKQFVRLKIQ